MFSSKGCYKRNTKTHERSLRLILNDYKSSFNSLFAFHLKQKKTVHQCCINILLTEVYKYLNTFSPDLMKYFTYAKTTTTYIILMSFPMIIRKTNTY